MFYKSTEICGVTVRCKKMNIFTTDSPNLTIYNKRTTNSAESTFLFTLRVGYK